LKQERAKALLQRRGGFEELGHRLGHVFEPLDVRDPLRGLEDELEIRRDLGRPPLQDGRFGQASERAIDLDGPEVFAVVAEHPLGRQVGGVERALPLLVCVPAGAGVEGHGLVSRKIAVGISVAAGSRDD